MKYRTVPTRTLKPGDTVCNYFRDVATARREIQRAENDETHDFCPEPCTADDIADAERWPVAVVEDKEAT